MTSLGWQLQFPVLACILVVLALVGVLGLLVYYKIGYEWEDIGAAISVFGFVVAGLSLIALALFAVPFNPKYWMLYEVQGNISDVKAVVQSDDSSITNQFVVTLDGQQRSYVVDNPRIVNLKSQQVDLACTIGWTYEAADQWNCDIR